MGFQGLFFKIIQTTFWFQFPVCVTNFRHVFQRYCDEFLIPKEVFLHHGSNNKNLSHFLHSYHGLGFLDGYLGPIFQKFPCLYLQKYLIKLISYF